MLPRHSSLRNRFTDARHTSLWSLPFFSSFLFIKFSFWFSTVLGWKKFGTLCFKKDSDLDNFLGPLLETCHCTALTMLKYYPWSRIRATQWILNSSRRRQVQPHPIIYYRAGTEGFSFPISTGTKCQSTNVSTTCQPDRPATLPNSELHGQRSEPIGGPSGSPSWSAPTNWRGVYLVRSSCCSTIRGRSRGFFINAEYFHGDQQTYRVE